jgi:hypothetical protein
MKNEDLRMEEAQAAVPFKDLNRDFVCRFERAYLQSAQRRSSRSIAAATRTSDKPRRAFFELTRKRGVASGRSIEDDHNR